MCNALSAERAVLWAALHDPALHARVADSLRAEFFTTPFHRACYEALLEDPVMEPAGLTPPERRALARMLKVAPPARVCDNLELLVAALADRAAGRPVDLLRLIN